MTTHTLSRRSLMMAAAALPFAPSLLTRPALAALPLQGPASASFNRFALGGFEVTTLLAGSRPLDKPQETYGLNATPEEFTALSAANFIPADRGQNFFTPVLVNTGAELILFDTGLDAGGIGGALAAAGVSPDQIDVVVLTHMHGDHIGGLTAEGGPTFPNARYVAGSAEFNHWSAAGNEGFDGKVKPLAEKMTFLDDGGAVAPGITAILAAGHTPGHLAFNIESDGKRLVLTADAGNHPVWSLARPDWEVRFDADKAAAAATRKTLFGMIASDRVPFVGYHMPFPGVGFVEPNAEGGFRWVPASYQMLL